MWNLEKYRDLFLESFGEDRRGMNTYKSLLKGFDFDDIRNWTDNTYIIKEFEQVHPKSTMDVKTRKSVLKVFFKWCSEQVDNQEVKMALLQGQLALTEISGTIIMNSIQVGDTQRFISNDELKNIIKQIDVSWDNPNAPYHSALFLAIYEGMYVDADFDVIKNARASDIEGNIITLYDKDSTFQLEISTDLKQRLLEISREKYAYRQNRYKYFEVPIYGQYDDTIFKTEQRLGKKEGVKFVYRAKIRKVVTEFLEFDLKPKALYVSGLMWKISNVLAENGYTLEDAFENPSPSKAVTDIVRAEMLKQNYPYDLAVLKMYVKDNLSDFKN